MQLTIGIDIGQRSDPTAIALAEMQWRATPPKQMAMFPAMKPYEEHYVIRHLGRLKLGTDYPTIAEKLVGYVKDVEDRVHAASLKNRAGWLEPEDYADLKTYMDATGVGKPVVDMVKKAGTKVIGVYFTHGDRRLVQKEEGTEEPRIVLGKAYMVSRLQVLLQTRRIHLPRTEEAAALVQELLDYEIKVDEKANDKYGAFKLGAHDDLVTALGLACNETPVYFGMIASDPGQYGTKVPEWAGGYAPQTLGGSLDQGGLNAWDNDGYGMGGGEYHPLDRFRGR